MTAKRYSTEFKSSIIALYNEGRSANSLANEYHLAVQTVTGWVKNLKSIPTAWIVNEKLDTELREFKNYIFQSLLETCNQELNASFLYCNRSQCI